MVNAPVCKTGTHRVNTAGSNPALPTKNKYLWLCSVEANTPDCLSGSTGSNPVRVAMVLLLTKED